MSDNRAYVCVCVCVLGAIFMAHIERIAMTFCFALFRLLLPFVVTF